jgi:DNA-directed RNA polymerase subunit RPC12/RpoP
MGDLIKPLFCVDQESFDEDYWVELAMDYEKMNWVELGYELSYWSICIQCGATIPRMEADEDSWVECPKCGGWLLVCSVCNGFLSPHVFLRSRLNPETGKKFFYCCSDCGDALDNEHPDWPNGGLKLEDVIDDIGIDEIKKSISIGKPRYHAVQFCDVCGYKTKPHMPLTLRTDLGLVCEKCGKEYAPELFELIKHFYDGKVDEFFLSEDMGKEAGDKTQNDVA